MNRHSRALVGAVLALGVLAPPTWPSPRPRGRPTGTARQNGEWRYLGGDVGHTRYSPLDQVTPANFETLKEAWRFSPLDVVGPMTARATPSYVGGKLLSVAGPRRHVVSIDPATGKLLWNFVEPETYRSKYSMRTAYGKGVAYHEINGQRRGLHLHAGLLPVRARRRDRPAARELGPAGAAPAFPSTASSTWSRT